MSTQFRARSTDEWVATCWYSGTGSGSRGVCLDFGAGGPERVREVLDALRRGEVIVDEYGGELPVGEFALTIARCRWTFGEYGGAMEVGAGDISRFEGLP